MITVREVDSANGLTTIRLESDRLCVEVVPAIGGRIIDITEKPGGHRFLWRNPGLLLQRSAPGSAYDQRFYGGIDEILPNDIPEEFNGTHFPDHGEIWTLPLDHAIEGNSLILKGALPLMGFDYTKKLTLRDESPHITIAYRIENRSPERKIFMWKLHAALAIEPGDTLVCPAKFAEVLDTEWSRWKQTEPFEWPLIQNERADSIPEMINDFDYLCLSGLDEGRIGLLNRSAGMEFTYHFDTEIFPYAHYFATYGGFKGLYTGVLEPCTTRSYSVVEENEHSRCSSLEPGEVLETTVTLYAGPIR